MMDAIGNTLQGTTAIRGSSQQSVNQTAQPEADPLAGSVNEPSRYYSPVVRIDSETQRTVLQFRDGSDGKVMVQYPSEKQLEAYRSKANTERAKEQEKAEAKVAGEKDAAASRNRPAGRFADRGQPAGELASAAPSFPLDPIERRSPFRSRRRAPEHRHPAPWSGHGGTAGRSSSRSPLRTKSYSSELQTGSGTARGTLPAWDAIPAPHSAHRLPASAARARTVPEIIDDGRPRHASGEPGQRHALERRVVVVNDHQMAAVESLVEVGRGVNPVRSIFRRNDRIIPV